MKALFAGAVVLAAAAGCSPLVPRDDWPGDREIAFDCSNGEHLSVRFLAAQQMAVLIRNGEALELQQKPAGSGFMYSNGPNTIRGKGKELTLEIGRRVPIQCRSR